MSAMFEFVDHLDYAERCELKSILSKRIPEFFNSDNMLKASDTDLMNEFRSVSGLLKRLPFYHAQIPANGIPFVGRIPCIDNDMIRQLQAEALERRYQPLDRHDHFLGCGGHIADQLSASPDLVTFISDLIGPVHPTGIASYLYYDQETHGIKPHVDTNVFSVNLIIMLYHQPAENGGTSATVVFPADLPPESYRLQVGETLLMYGSHMIHTRTPLQKGEEVHLLTIGFSRADQECSG